MDKLKIIYGSLIIILLLDACSYRLYKKTQPQYHKKYLYEFPDEAYLDRELIGMWHNKTVSSGGYNYSASNSSASKSISRESNVRFNNKDYTGSQAKREGSRVPTKVRKHTASETRRIDSGAPTRSREVTVSQTIRVDSEAGGRCVVLKGSESRSIHTKCIEFTVTGDVIYTPNFGKPNGAEYWGQYKTLYDTLYFQFNIGRNFSESLEVFVFEMNGSSLYIRRVEKYGTTNRLLGISNQTFEIYNPFY